MDNEFQDACDNFTNKTVEFLQEISKKGLALSAEVEARWESDENYETKDALEDFQKYIDEFASEAQKAMDEMLRLANIIVAD